MATVNFTVTRYGKSRGAGAATVRSSETRISGQDTITTVENLEYSTGNDLTLAVGEILAIHSDIALRIAFGGTAATGTTGHYIPASQIIEIEVADAGTVSVIEAA